MLFAVFYVFFRGPVQIRGWIHSFSAPRGARLEEAGKLIEDDLASASRTNRDKVLARYTNAYQVRFILFQPDGFQIAGRKNRSPAGSPGQDPLANRPAPASPSTGGASRRSKWKATGAKKPCRRHVRPRMILSVSEMNLTRPPRPLTQRRCRSSWFARPAPHAIGLESVSPFVIHIQTAPVGCPAATPGGVEFPQRRRVVCGLHPLARGRRGRHPPFRAALVPHGPGHLPGLFRKSPPPHGACGSPRGTSTGQVSRDPE